MNPDTLAVLIKDEVNKALDELATKTFYRGIVTAVDGSKADIKIEGSTVARPNVTCLGSYKPQVGDQVVVISIGLSGANYLCIGRTSDGASAGNPIGEIIMTLKSVADDGFLLMDGSTYTKEAYPKLWTLISTNPAYGTTTSTNFTLKNLAGRSPMMIKSSDADINTLGGFFGSKRDTLTIAQMPAHSHGVNDPGHSHGLSETYNLQSGANRTSLGGGGNVAWNRMQTDGSGTGIWLSNNGSGQSHNTTHEVFIANYQVRAQ